MTKAGNNDLRRVEEERLTLVRAVAVRYLRERLGPFWMQTEIQRLPDPLDRFFYALAQDHVGYAGQVALEELVHLPR